MFIQIHTLTGYSGVLLNRDDAGLAKRITYGGTVRTRVSSQSIKYKLRNHTGLHAIANLGDMAVRSRRVFRDLIAGPMIAAGKPQDHVIELCADLIDLIFPSKKAKKNREARAKQAQEENDPLLMLERGEIGVFSKSEIDYFSNLLAQFVAMEDTQAAKAALLVAGKDIAKNLQEAAASTSLDAAAFGRMTTGDVMSRIDAAVHVAHAFTTHPQETEVDFFTAMDDLRSMAGESGGGHMGDVELTAPLLYSYVVVDFNQLLANIAGVENHKEVAAHMVGNLIHMLAQDVVGAKKGSTAPYSSSDLVLVEVGQNTPRTLAEAFRPHVEPGLQASTDALTQYLGGKDRMYPMQGHRWVAAALETNATLGTPSSVPDLVGAVQTLLQA